MTQFVNALQDVDSAAFVLLGVAVGAVWFRRRDPSLAWLAAAIVLLSSVSLLGRVPVLLHFDPKVLSGVSLLAFAGSGYALLRYRASVISLPWRWHAAAVVAVVCAGAATLAATYVPVSKPVQLTAVLSLLVVWSAMVAEPAVRFWLVSRRLPSVQAWRLRSVSAGFGGIVAILFFAIAASLATRSAVVQVMLGLVVLLIVPALYVSFAPPGWLRRQWRAREDQDLMAFMRDLARLSEDPRVLMQRMLEWSIRLAGGQSAVAFDHAAKPLAVSGLQLSQVAAIKSRTSRLEPGLHQVRLDGIAISVLVFDMGFTSTSGRLVVLAGRFTPGFGTEEMVDLQQLIVAAGSALDRAALLDTVKDSNAKLVEANKHKSIFLASMSHELRTPLNSILGFSELLLDAHDGQFPEATERRFLEQIHSSGKHLLGIINDILDLSKIEAGQMELRLQSVNVAEVVRQVASIAEPLAANSNITINTDAGTAGTIEADAAKLKQMVLNLVSNAIKFTLPGGTVSIAARRLDAAVEITVADNGIGIARADQARIFNEFQQVDSSVGRQREGTGLGLSLTRRFAVMHGGDVTVASELGKGSTFTLRMPLRTASTEVRASRPSNGAVDPREPKKAAGPLVMVIEDDAASAELLRRQLEKAGYRTEIVTRGADALSKAAALKPMVITLDVLLPDVDGWEVLKQLKSDPATRSTPVIVISIVDNPELASALGALDFVLKPVAAQDLLERLERLRIKPQTANRKADVLVVDDEAANREWLANVLNIAGFGVIEARGGAEAIRLAGSEKPSLVLLDLMMPDVTGFDVVEKLKADDGTKQIPILVLTSKDLTEADKKQLNGHVSKILTRGSTGATQLIDLLQAAAR